jgi:AcrR family transcriptional regulator
MDSQASPSPAAARRYRGITGAERREQRRALLLEAGLELFGTRGYGETSVQAVCEAAGLNRRYFYESFDGAEDLLCQVYEQIVRDMAAEVVEVTARAETIEDQARSGLQAAWRTLAGDRRKARIIAIEVVGVSERLERMRRRNRHAFADITMRNALSLAAPGTEFRLDPVLAARALMGACMELLVDWVHGDIDATPEEVVEYLTQLLTTTAYAAVAPPAGGEARASGRAGKRRPAHTATKAAAAGKASAPKKASSAPSPPS